MQNRSAPSFSIPAAAPGRLTVLASLLAGLCAPALAASDIVISQVYGAGGNGSGATGAVLKNDFIELFNRGTAPVSLNGWSVQYASAAGATWQVTPLTNVVLQPGQYYLVHEAAGTGGTVVGAAPDKTGTIAMGAGAGKVALSNGVAPLSSASPGGASLIDLVGYGAANFQEGSAPAGALGNLTSAQRNGDGCTDSDNNGADFSVLAPAPRNTATPLRVCGAPVFKPIVASCPATLALAQGFAGATVLGASDDDGIVNGASITAGVVPGITLDGFNAAGAVGAAASVTLSAGGALAAGTYPVTVQFVNDQGQSASCAIDVKISGLAAVTRRIPAIQGAGAASPYAGTVQTTEGVLTVKVGTGFFIQDAAGDGDPSTSDGLFVYTGSAAANVQVGDLVRVTGSVTEYTPNGANRSYTELSNVTAVVPVSSGHAIAPTNIALGDNLASVEGMLVRFTHPLTVTQAEFLGSRGELTLSGARLEVPTNRYAPRSPEAIALAAANAANMIVLDDGIFVTPVVIPYIGQDRTVRAGDSVADLTGVIDFGAIGGGGAAFKLQPAVAPVFSRDNPRQGPPQLAPGNVKVASANVLNFFTTFTNGGNVEGQTGQGCKLGASTAASNCRGANNMAEFIRQRDKIVAELKAIDADVYGLMEIQNNGEYAVGYLASQLNAAIGAPVYAVVPAPPATGTDAIRVAMLYKPSRLTLSGAALSDDAPINNRPPMAQTFMAANGEKFSLVVNHLKSKGSCPAGGADSDQGDSQSCWNATRIQQAQRLVGSFVPQVVAAAADPDVLLIGDMNSYGMEDPVATMLAAGFVNQLERYVRPLGMPYSFIFDGASGYLDHALASTALSRQVLGAAEWHLNADEPTVIDYNLDGKPQDLYDASAYRASDHDPVVISLDLRPSYVDLGASVKLAGQGLAYNRATQKFTGNLYVSNTGATALTGPFQLKLAGLTAGVTLDNASGSNAGSPYITVDVGTLAPGATLTIPLVFTNPSKGGIAYAAKFYSGTF
ncbi:MAG: ExeM/NucH family extracellular endonuclease [Pseudomonadota bacterium]